MIPIQSQYRYKPRGKTMTIKVSTVIASIWLLSILATLAYLAYQYRKENLTYNTSGDTTKLVALMDADELDFSGALLPPPVMGGK